MKYDVVFRLIDEAADPEDDGGGWQREAFDTEAEAHAFAAGLTFGDEARYEVDEVVECHDHPDI